jgi:hypothetical protein
MVDVIAILLIRESLYFMGLYFEASFEWIECGTDKGVGCVVSRVGFADVLNDLHIFC